MQPYLIDGAPMPSRTASLECPRLEGAQFRRPSPEMLNLLERLPFRAIYGHRLRGDVEVPFLVPPSSIRALPRIPPRISTRSLDAFPFCPGRRRARWRSSRVVHRRESCRRRKRQSVRPALGLRDQPQTAPSAKMWYTPKKSSSRVSIFLANAGSVKYIPVRPCAPRCRWER